MYLKTDNRLKQSECHTPSLGQSTGRLNYKSVPSIQNLGTSYGMLPKVTTQPSETSYSNKGCSPSLKQSTVFKKTGTKASLFTQPINQTKKIQVDDFDEIFKSSNDKELQAYKYVNKNYGTVEKKYKMHKFIFDKKKYNKVKYSSSSKINVTAIPVPKGTLSIMLNVAKKDYGFDLSQFKAKIPSKSKFKMKWKTIQWLNANKADAIKQLKIYQEQLKERFSQGGANGLSKDQFKDLLSRVGLGADENLADKLFYIFDDDGNGTVDYKELIMGIEMFKSTSVEDKLKVFMDLCDRNQNQDITQDELYNVLKQNIFNHDDKVKMKQLIRQLYKDYDVNKDGVLNQNELFEATTKNTQLRSLLEESIRSVKRVDQMIESDLEEPFHCWVPISANFVNYKEGIHYVLVNKLMTILEEVEDSHMQKYKSRLKYREAVHGKDINKQENLKEENFGDSFTEQH